MKVFWLLLSIGSLVSCSNSDQMKVLENEINSLKIQKQKTMDIATQNKASVKAFFSALEKEEAHTLAHLFAVDAKHINPYHSEIFPTGANGRKDIQNYWARVFPNFDGMEFQIDEIYAMEDPHMVFVKYNGNITLKAGSGIYSNAYYSTFKFDGEGKITEYVEIFNPIVAARGFGLLDKIK